MISEDLQRQIQELIQNPTFAAAAESLAQDYYNEWSTTGPCQTDTREELFRKQRVLVEVVQKLNDLALDRNA